MDGNWLKFSLVASANDLATCTFVETALRSVVNMSRLVVRLVCCSIVAVVLHVVRLVLSLLCDRYLQAALITIAAAQSTTAATASAATTTSAAQTIAGQCANSTAAGTCATTFSTALQAQTGAGTVSYYNQYCTNYGNYLTCLGSNSTTGAGCPASGTVYSTAAMNCQAVFTSKPLGASCSCAAGATGGSANTPAKPNVSAMATLSAIVVLIAVLLL